MRLALQVALVLPAFALLSVFQDEDHSGDNKYFGKWQVVAEFSGEVMQFSEEFDSVELTEDWITLRQGEENQLLEFRKVPAEDNEGNKDELGLLAWYKEGSADGTPPGVPIMAFLMKVEEDLAILRIQLGDWPIDGFKYQEKDAMASVFLVLRKMETK